jgi:hypothetical protein
MRLHLPTIWYPWKFSTREILKGGSEWILDNFELYAVLPRQNLVSEPCCNVKSHMLEFEDKEAPC